MKKIVNAFLVAAVISQISLSVHAQLNCMNENCSNEDDISLFETSPPNVPAMHSSSFLQKSVQAIPVVETPFGDENFVFCGNSKGFKDLVYKKLVNLVQGFWWCTNEYQDWFYKMANGTVQPRYGFISKFLSKLTSKTKEREAQELVSLNLNVLRCGRYQEATLSYDWPCIFVANRYLDNIRKYKPLSTANLRRVNQEISSIIKSDMPLKLKIEKLNELVDNEYERHRKFKNESSTEELINFCVPLYRLNNELSNWKKNWAQKNLDERREIYKLGAKINKLMPNYCFLTENDKAPFAGVRLDSYILVTDTEDTKRIYLEKGQIPQFINNLVKSIDSKYTNIKGTYSFDVVKADDILKLAAEIHANNHQDLIDAMAQKADKAESLRKKKLAALGTDFIKIALVKGGLFELLVGDDTRFKVSPEAAQRFLEEKRPELIKSLPTPVNGDKEKNFRETPTGQALISSVEELHLGSTQMSRLELELGKIIEYSSIAEKARKEQNKLDALKKELDGNKDYLNAVKLLTQFSKFNFPNLPNVDAIIIEENKQYELGDFANKNLREYSIIEIKRVDDDQ